MSNNEQKPFRKPFAGESTAGYLSHYLGHAFQWGVSPKAAKAKKPRKPKEAK